LLAFPAAPATGTSLATRVSAATAVTSNAGLRFITRIDGGRVLVSFVHGAPHTAVVLPARGSGRGGLSVTMASVSPARTRPGVPRYTLTVTGTNVGGQPDTGDPLLVGKVSNANASGTGLGVFDHGIAKFTVPSGTYWAVAILAQFSSRHRLIAVRLDVLPQFTVTRNTTVHTRAAAATSKVSMITPRPSIARSESLTLVRTAPGAPPSVLSPKVSSLGESVANASLWVSPVSHRPGYGALRVYTSAQLTSPPGQASGYSYTLDVADPPGIIPSQHFVVHPADLATVSERYVQDVRSVVAWQTFGGTAYQVRTSALGGPTLPLRLPLRQTHYLSASPAMFWKTFYSEYRTISRGQTPGGQTGAFRLLHPGQHLTQTWGAYPLHPGTNVSFPHTRMIVVRSSAARAGNTLSLDVTPFSDNQPGHLGDGLAVPFPGKVHQVSGRYAVYQNGVKIAGGNAVKATGGYGDLQVSAALAAKPALIKFVLSASRASAQYHLSATSRDVWTWHSRPEPGATIPAPWLCNFAPGPASRDRRCAVQPMMTLRYSVAGLGIDGAAKPGNQAITITAGHIQLAPQVPVTQAGVQVSFDGGKTWQPAQVRPLGSGRFRATFTAPPSAEVSLRSTADDLAGNGLTETILNAYQTRGV
jgi:hypothetical protein